LPFCERGSALKLAGRIAEEEAWKFLHDVASGLAYLHRQNPPVIHQDIKPDNVLMDNTGQFMITDFGISTKVRSTLRKSVGQQNVSGGTLAYMGPERFSRDNTPIKAGDIWALGATLYELFVGDTPFGDHGGVIQKSGAEIPNIKGNMSPDLMHIVNLCLQKETWDRPTAETIIAWTEQHSRGEKINFGKLPQPPKPKKPSKPTPPPKPATPSKPTVAGEKKSVLKNVLLIIAGSIVGLLIIFFIAGKTFAPSEEQLRDFEKYKNAAITNYDFAKKLGDKFSYQEALKNCTKALSIKKDDELKKMKQDIETELELKQ
jgi:serine/threonine protein kinase